MQARSTRFAGSVRDREISASARRWSALIDTAMIRRAATMASPCHPCYSIPHIANNIIPSYNILTIWNLSTSNPDHLVRLEFDEFEGAGADRMSAHVARRDMAGINRRPARRQQRDESGLRPLQVKGDFVIAVDRHLFEVSIPRFARIDAELLGRLASEHVPGALDVASSEGFAVMPPDAVAQGEGQLRALLVPRPSGC